MEAMTYKGRDVETLTREELLVAVRWAYYEIIQLRACNQMDREMDRMFAETRAAVTRKQRSV